MEKIKNVCINYSMSIPTEMKMYYNVEAGKYDAQYKYEPVCSEKTGKSAGEVFLERIAEIKG